MTENLIANSQQIVVDNDNINKYTLQNILILLICICDYDWKDLSNLPEMIKID